MNIRIKKDHVEIDGYVNSVERLSKPLRDRDGIFKERVKAGAFKKALDRARDVRLLLNHDSKRDLGGTADGNLTLKEDAIGLHANATITDGDVADMARSGDLIGWSFGFQDVDVEGTEENGIPVRNVKDLILFEVSLINKDAIPAYDGTLVAVRTATNEMYNVAGVTESDMNVQILDKEQTEEIETRETKTETKTESNDHEEVVIDYTAYRNMIKEMKGEKES